MNSLRYIRNILKISIFLLLLVVCVGSIYAADDSQSDVGESLIDDDDDFDLDEYLDDEDLDDDYWDDEDFDDDDYWDEYWDDEDLDDEDWEDYNESEDDYSDFDYLKFKITYYLDRYGNCSYHNWTESDEFLGEYQIYLANSSDYKLNESAEGYETYLKIFDSITSTFGDFNLTENETDYLKFMVIFYLNHYGNVSANYTWNESESFANFTPPFHEIGCCISSGSSPGPNDDKLFAAGYSPFYVPLNSYLPDDVNQTSTNSNQTSVEVQKSSDFNIFMLILILALMILIVI